MEKVYIKEVQHKGQARIKLIFTYDRTILLKVKKLQGVKWSQSMRCWHIPYSDDYRVYINNVFSSNYKIVTGENKVSGEELTGISRKERKIIGIYQENNNYLKDYFNTMKLKDLSPRMQKVMAE